MEPISAVKSSVKVELEDGNEYILIPSRLPFGGSLCPNEFCLISDLITDAVNDLLENDSWNSDEISSDYCNKIPSLKTLDEGIPFGMTRELSVDIPMSIHGKADVYIDNIITVAVDMNDNVKRISKAPCTTIIHAVADKSISSPLPCDNMIADNKTFTKGASEEIKICLGWEINTRELKISLPLHKYKAWDSQIEEAIKFKSVKLKTLESIIGRLENVAQIMPMLGHFLNNIRFMQSKASSKKHNVFFSRRGKEDLKLARKFLIRAKKGLRLNLITFRAPTITYIGDASKHGLGGFASHGRAWSFTIPMELQGRAHINLLEFLTQVVSIWIDIVEGRLKKHDCLLCMGNSTTVMGWLRRSNFEECKKGDKEGDKDWLVKQDIARKLAMLVLDEELLLYQQ